MPDTTDRAELLNCPFCGGPAICRPDEYGSGGQHVPPYHAGCRSCRVFMFEEEEDDAIAAWNKRAALSAAPPTDLHRTLPHPGSPEASAMLDSLLAEYNWPANTKNAARAGWEAANRWLAASPSASQPEPKKDCPYCLGSGVSQVLENGRHVDSRCSCLASASLTPPAPEASEAKAMAESFARYCELLYAVHRKFPGESRHETALRYIREAEASASDSQASANADRT